jgi:hypothetical protein
VLLAVRRAQRPERRGPPAAGRLQSRMKLPDVAPQPVQGPAAPVRLAVVVRLHHGPPLIFFRKLQTGVYLNRKEKQELIPS